MHGKETQPRSADKLVKEEELGDLYLESDYTTRTGLY